jgi:hypothetical protein
MPLLAADPAFADCFPQDGPLAAMLLQVKEAPNSGCFSGPTAVGMLLRKAMIVIAWLV